MSSAAYLSRLFVEVGEMMDDGTEPICAGCGKPLRTAVGHVDRTHGVAFFCSLQCVSGKQTDLFASIA